MDLGLVVTKQCQMDRSSNTKQTQNNINDKCLYICKDQQLAEVYLNFSNTEYEIINI